MKSNERNKRLILFSRLLFVIYVFAVIYIMFFAEGLGRTEYHIGYSYNLHPFQEIRRFEKLWKAGKSNVAFLNLFGNVICFVPFGLFFPIIHKRRKYVFIPTVLAIPFFSLGIELTQLLCHVGSFDVDDIILNTTGGFIGLILYYILLLVYRKWNKRVGERHEE